MTVVAGVTHLKHTTNTGSKMKDINKLIEKRREGQEV